METKMLAIVVEKLSDDLGKVQQQIKEMLIQIESLKIKKADPENPQTTVKSSETEFITLSKVREILKMSRNSVLQMVHNGLIRQVRMTKRTIRYVRSEIQSLTQF